MAKNVTGAKEPRNNPSDLDGPGYSAASYRPGNSHQASRKGTSEDDVKRGFKKGG